MATPIGLEAGKELIKANLLIQLRTMRDEAEESDNPDEYLKRFVDLLVDQVTDLIKTSIVQTTGTAAAQVGALS